MNRSFRLVWNAALGLWMVASELAKGKTKTKTFNRSSRLGARSTGANCLLLAAIGLMPLSNLMAETAIWDYSGSGSWDDVSGEFVVGYLGIGELNISDGATLVVNDDLYVGRYGGSSGTVNVSGNDSSLIVNDEVVVGYIGTGELNISDGATLDVNGEFVVGYKGTGELNISDGATLDVSNDLYVGENEGSSGTINVSGSDSSFVGLDIYVGSEGAGELNISDGATLVADYIVIGGSEGSSGTVNVSGSGTTLTAEGFSIGWEGQSSLVLSDGATLVADYIGIGYIEGSSGTVNVSGSGTTLTTEDILIGYEGQASLVLSDGAEIKVTTYDVWIADDEESIGTFSIGAAKGETATAAGTLTLSDGVVIAFAEGTGSLVFNHTEENYIFDADIENYISDPTDTSASYDNSLIALYAGTTSFTGDLTEYYGKMTVDGGTLSIADGDTLEIGGDYTQTSAGVLKVGASSNSNYGKLAGAGTATFAANSAIAVDVASANSLAVDGSLSSVVSADTLEASTFSVTDNSALFDFSAVVNDDTVDLVIVQGTTDSTDSTDSSNVTSVTRYVTEQGHASSMGAAAMLDTFVSGGTTGTDMDYVVTALGQLSTGVEVSNAVAQTLPLLQGATNQVSASVTQTTSRVIQTRQAVTSGTSSGDGFITDKQGWVKVIGSSAKQDELNGSSGFESKSYGVIGGIDGEMNANSSMGIALSYVDSSIESTSTSSYNSAEIDSYQVAFYGQYALGANYHNVDVSWQADLGLNQTEGFRDITFMNREADSSYDSYAGHVGAGVGRVFSVAASTALVPSLRADYYYVHNESYTESGAGALNLEVESSNAEDFILTLQGDLQHEMNDQLFISASLGIGYDMMNDAASLTASYVGGGTTFTTAGLEQSPWIVTTGLAMNYSVNDTTQITASYDVQGREGFLNQTASAKVKWLF
jgi:T5SS/PEP-CTERM-associated repeat protein